MSHNEFKTNEPIEPQEASPMEKKMSVVGIDIAKQVFHLVGMDEQGTILMRKRLYRAQVMAFIAQLPPTLIGMEACGGAHDWARRFREHGHEVKLMAPQFVKPYVKVHKNALRDAEEIAEAVTRPTRRFVPAKAIDQQDLQALHRVRERLMGGRTALINEVHGLMNEYGIVVVFQKWRWPFLHRPSEGIAVDKQANDDVVHLCRFREAHIGFQGRN